MSDTASPLSLPAFNGSIVHVSIMAAGHLIGPPTIVVQSPKPGHEILDTPIYSFLVENEMVGKKLWFELGMMKDWKEKLPNCTSPSHRP